jgi:hypothetical protein
MSEERFEQDEREDEDVEAHRRATTRHDSAVSAELGDDDDDNDDVEAHRRSTT